MATEPGRRARGRWAGTVRLRITLVAAAAVAVVLVVAGVVLLTVQRRALTEQLDESLDLDVDGVLAAITGPAAGDEVPIVLASPGDDDAVAQVVTLDGTVVAATPNVAGQPAIADAPGSSSTRTVSDIGGEDGPFRLVSRRVGGAGDEPIVVHVASPVDDIDEAVRALGVALLVLVPLVTALLGGVVFVLVGRTLRPVERIRAEVAGIGLDDLDRRVPRPPGDDEIARLATTMNEMLARLAASNRRQQRFVADASHELRTPLARMRAEVDVDVQHPETADHEATSRSVLGEIDHLRRLIDDLLLLARSDAGTAAAPHRAVDLDDVVLDEVRASAGADVTIDATAVSGAQVLGDQEQLRRVVRNVLDNAIRHAEHTVTVMLGEEADHAVLTVTDDGPGIPAEHAEEIFERFTTLDDARTADGGTGLGLAIARDLLRLHDGTIVVDTAHRSGARLVVTVRVAAPPG